MRVIQIPNSYSIWWPDAMATLAEDKCLDLYDTDDVELTLNRGWRSIYIEWWLHNIGYFLTLPFVHNEKIKRINERCKDVDLEEWK